MYYHSKPLPIFILGALFLASCPAFTQSSKLNVLLFTADDLDRNTLGCYGSKVPDISPNLDKFAEEGIRFNHAFINASICVPSRAILATGLYGHNSGVMGFMKMKENSSIPLIMEILRENNYRVGVLGKVSHSTPKETFTWDYSVDQDELGAGRSPGLYYNKAKDFFSECKEENRPFYFMVNSHDPHRPFFNLDEPLLRSSEPPSRIYSPEEIEVPGFLPDLPQVRLEMSYYYNSARRLDDTFGKVMRALEESGVRENTLVIFLSDNGIAVPFAKCDNYYASTRTPWLVRWPGVIKPGQVDSVHFISGVDFLPTVLDALDIVPPENPDGISRLPVYLGQKQKTEEFIYTQIDSKATGKAIPMKGISVPMRAIQNNEFLYIYNFWVDGKRIYGNNNEGLTMKAMEEAAVTDPEIADRVKMFRYRVPEELYNLKTDHDCLLNLIDDPAFKKHRKTMRKALKKKMAKTGDPLLDAYLNRHSPEEVREELYRIYPEIKKIDASEINL